MKTTNTLILIALSTIFLASCSMEKRLYNKGFHVSWNKKYKSSDKQKDTDDSFALNVQEDNPNTAKGSTFEHFDMTMNDAELIPSDALKREIKDAPVTRNIAQIESNTNSLKLDVVKEGTSSAAVTVKQGKLKPKAKTEGEGSSSGGSSQIVALVLVLLVGALGIHRFYLGHIGIGILMLLTGGVCGILLLVDLIRIITGDLKPKYGEYTETL